MSEQRRPTNKPASHSSIPNATHKGPPLSATDTAKTFQGNPCRLGHTLRYLSNGKCAECTRARSLLDAKANPAARREYGIAWRQANPERVADAKRKWRAENGDQLRAAIRAARADNPGKAGADRARYRANQFSALCSCCPRESFEPLYASAVAAGCHVDHIRPLSVGGKHCLRNLQILSPADHKAKSARDLIAIAAHKRDWLSAEDSPDWSLPASI